jgi:hypothetical protein
VKENTVILDIERYHELQDKERIADDNQITISHRHSDGYTIVEYCGELDAINSLSDQINENREKYNNNLYNYMVENKKLESDIERLKNRPLLLRIFNK